MSAPKIDNLSDWNPIDFTGYEEHFGDDSKNEEPAEEEYGGVPGIKVEPYFEDGVTLGEAACVKEEVEKPRDPRDAEVIFLDGPDKDSVLICPKDPCDGEVIFLDGAESKESVRSTGERREERPPKESHNSRKYSPDGTNQTESVSKANFTVKKKYCCFVCNFESPSACSLSMHIGKHSPTEIKRKRVSRKTKPTGTVSNNVSYKKRKRKANPQRFVCEICDYNCLTADYLGVHIKKHSPEEVKSSKAQNDLSREKVAEKPFVCHFCKVRFKSSVYLTQHIKGHYTTQFYCSSCDFRSVSKIQLNAHIKTCCEYVCGTCSYVCRTSEDLEKHKRKHIVICRECGADMKNLVNLRWHLEVAHNPSADAQTKRYLCNVCDFECTQSDEMWQHMTEHTKDI